MIIRHNHERKFYENRIGEIEEDLLSKLNVIDEMRNEISHLKLKLKMPPIQEQSVYEEETEKQESKITELSNLLQERDNQLFQYEVTSKSLNEQISELKDIIQVNNTF